MNREVIQTLMSEAEKLKETANIEYSKAMEKAEKDREDAQTAYFELVRSARRLCTHEQTEVTQERYHEDHYTESFRDVTTCVDCGEILKRV